MSQEDPLEEGMATHSSILAWRIPWTFPGLGDHVDTGFGHMFLKAQACPGACISGTFLAMIAVCSVVQSRSILCDSMDCSPPCSSVHRVLQARHGSGLPCPPPGDLPDLGIEPMSLMSPALAGGFFTTEPPGKPTLGSVFLNHSISY